MMSRVAIILCAVFFASAVSGYDSEYLWKQKKSFDDLKETSFNDIRETASNYNDEANEKSRTLIVDSTNYADEMDREFTSMKTTAQKKLNRKKYSVANNCRHFNDEIEKLKASEVANVRSCAENVTANVMKYFNDISNGLQIFNATDWEVKINNCVENHINNETYIQAINCIVMAKVEVLVMSKNAVHNTIIAAKTFKNIINDSAKFERACAYLRVKFNNSLEVILKKAQKECATESRT